MLRIVSAVALAALGLVWSSSAGAQTNALPETPIFVDKQSTAFRVAAAALARKAAQRGHVRVIAGLRASVGPLDELSDADAARQRAALKLAQARVGARVLGPGAPGAVMFDTIPFVSMFVSATQLNRLIADPDVVSIEEDVPLRPMLTQSVPFINADDVWAAGFPGTDYTIAVLDTGVLKTHGAFAGKIVSEACYSTTGSGVRSFCPDGAAESTAPGSGVNCPISIEGCDHGTHVAGIAAGDRAALVLRGVAPGADIIAIQVFSKFLREIDCFFTTPCIAAFFTDVIKGLERVYELRTTHRIAAVNLSLGGGLLWPGACDFVNPAAEAIIRTLRSVRIATVVAAGNQGQDERLPFPACLPSAIAVGSTLHTSDMLSDFSNHSGLVRLLAPGSEIMSAAPRNRTSIKSGTSMATPHVAGAVALMRDVKTNATVDDIAAALECTGVPVTRAGITEPRIDVDAARAYLLDPPNTPAAYDFDNAGEAAAWQPVMGDWSVANGKLTADRNVGWKIVSHANCNHSLDISVVMRRIDPNASAPTNSGIFFKTQINPESKTVSGYFAAYNRGGGGGQVFLNRLTNYNFATQAGFFQNLCIVNGHPIQVNQRNQMRVISRGGRHRVIVNGVEACNITDHAYGTGRVTIGSYLTDPKGHLFSIDRVTINPLVPTPSAGAEMVLR
jgi:subtilisin family serine protease